MCFSCACIIHLISRHFDEECMSKDELEQYVDKEAMYLNNQINLLRFFKPGNIGFRDVFFEFSFSVIGIINNKIKRIRFY